MRQYWRVGVQWVLPEQSDVLNIPKKHYSRLVRQRAFMFPSKIERFSIIQLAHIVLPHMSTFRSQPFKYTLDDSNSLGSIGSLFQSQPTERITMAGTLRLFDQENTVSTHRFQHISREFTKSYFQTPAPSDKPIVRRYEPEQRRAGYKWESKFAHYDRQGVLVPNRLIRKVKVLKELKQHFRAVNPHQSSQQSNPKQPVRMLTRAEKLCAYEWLSDLVYTMGYTRSTYHKTINLFERLSGLTRSNCQLYIVTCFMLAAKLEEHTVHSSSFVEMCKGLHDLKELLNCQKEVLLSPKVNFAVNSEVILNQAELLMSQWNAYLENQSSLLPHRMKLFFRAEGEGAMLPTNHLQMGLMMDRLLVLGKLVQQQHNYQLAVLASLFVIVGLEIGQILFNTPAKHSDPRKHYPATCRIIQQFLAAQLPQQSSDDLFEVLPDVIKASSVLQHLPVFLQHLKSKNSGYCPHQHFHFKQIFEQPH